MTSIVKVKAVSTTYEQALNLKQIYQQIGLTVVIYGNQNLGKVIIK